MVQYRVVRDRGLGLSPGVEGGTPAIKLLCCMRGWIDEWVERWIAMELGCEACLGSVDPLDGIYSGVWGDLG